MPIRLVQKFTDVDAPDTASTSTSGTSLSKVNHAWEILSQDYLQLRDMVANALAGAGLELALCQQSAIILRGEEVPGIEPLNAAVVQLAQEFDATLISFDLGDIQDVAWDFNLQHIERRELNLPFPEPGSGCASPNLANDSLADAILDDIFVNLSYDDVTWELDAPVPKPTAAVLDSPKVKAQQKLHDSGSSFESSEVTAWGTLVHIQNVDEFLKRRGGLYCIENFGALVEERRINGDKILLIISTLSTERLPVEDDLFFLDTPRLEKMREKLLIRSESILPMSATRYPQSEDKSQRERFRYARQIRRAVRHNISQELLGAYNHLLAPYPEEDFAQDDDVVSVIKGKDLSDVNALRAALQISGRMVRSAALTMGDIRDVLEMIHNSRPEKDLSAKEKFKLKLEALRNECNDYEEQMLQCVVDTSQLETKYEDVIIENETKEIVKQLISLSQMSRQAHPLLRQVQMKGALFYGPPGTGKTHLTRAIARESGVSMVAVDAGKLLDRWVGETEKKILALFSICKKLYPCLLFIDEADSLFYRRNSQDASWRRNDVTLFLQQMDGLLTDEKTPFVIVATNRPSDLDEAFLRRLPYKAQFALPTEGQRAEILRLFLRDEDIEDSIIIEQLARKTEGYSGADLKSLCGQAALSWSVEQNSAEKSAEGVEKPKLLLTAQHFTKALRRSQPAATPQSIKINNDFRQGTTARTRARP